MKLNILHIAKFYYPYSGGMETIIKDQCEGLADRGHNVRVLCTNTSREYKTESINNVKVIRYPLLAKLSSQTISPQLLLGIIKHAKWADVVHIHSPNPLCEVMTLLLRKKTKIISTHHSDIYRQKFLKKLYRPFWNKFVERLDKIIVPTKNHIIHSDMINEQEDKCSLVPFGIKKDNYLDTKNDDSIKDQYGKYILFVGRLVEYKGVKYLINALKRLDINLVIIGKGPEQKSLEELVNNDISLKHKVHFQGRVECQKTVNAFFKNAFAFCLPSISKNENFGIVQLEAMINSLPIITTDIKSGVPAVGIPNKTTLIAKAKDSNSLEAHIRNLINSPNFASKLGREGHNLYHQKYTYDLMINGLEDQYYDLLEINDTSIKSVA